RLVGKVGVAGDLLLQGEALVDPVQAGGDDRGQGQVGVDVASWDPVLQPQRVAVADHPQGAGAVGLAPGDGGRGEAAGRVPLVGVDVGGQEQGQLAQAGQLPGQELLHQLRVAVVTAVAGHDGRVVVGRAQAEVDVAGVALALVVLGHEGQAGAVLGGDLLGPVLVDDVPVGGGQGVGVAEGDLVLAVVALALGRLDPHARPGPGGAGAAPEPVA